MFYARAINYTMLTTVGYITTHISTGQWDNINNWINQFLDYAATHTDAKITHHKSGMHLWVHAYAYYLTETKAISRAGGYHYFSNKPKIPILSDNPQPKHNQPVIFLWKVIDALMISMQESKTGGGYINAKEALPIRQTAIEMGHIQGLTPLQFEKNVHMAY